jgi:hypothetical protein
MTIWIKKEMVGVVMHTCNTSTQKDLELEASLEYTVTLSQNK